MLFVAYPIDYALACISAVNCIDYPNPPKSSPNVKFIKTIWYGGGGI
jgi:hypothetical protein